MAPPAPTEPPSDEETPFASWDEFGRPLSDESNPLASGFSQGTQHEHNLTAHNNDSLGLGGLLVVEEDVVEEAVVEVVEEETAEAEVEEAVAEEEQAEAEEEEVVV
ncbi:hypothetical protein AB1Y20_011747 [Prymnesium parvum]|uniref:Uncharacterized protein n=1 Tax=Prymnesium parvum TaxID=97485 RepID=A0AB34IHE3_PRYPA